MIYLSGVQSELNSRLQGGVFFSYRAHAYGFGTAVHTMYVPHERIQLLRTFYVTLQCRKQSAPFYIWCAICLSDIQQRSEDTQHCAYLEPFTNDLRVKKASNNDVLY